VLSALVVIVVVGWAFTLRPQRFGGPAAFITVDGTSMTPTMHNGDLAVVQKQSTYHRGDVIAYQIPRGYPGAGYNVIHRIVGGNGTTGFITRGDHNRYTDPLWHPTTRDVIGKVWFHVPHFAGTVNWLRSPAALALAVGIITFVIFMRPARRPNTVPRDAPPAIRSGYET
jgi:signal peptidase I